ncbi:hypothetical protein GL213_09940 [Halogeometricum borinquense]|uniref:Swt1-like HEPN domain-containing protein n=1 Tax=Halogeometricum borinquense (strain ATCC 700274 / DSM 11551 / JCM 10706 / KCTC 4070 / PR3) TaxID=469382 RepID=E4NNV3_HALBP|nr:hypothetical protein [Halogeometricum borinquense]ADQ67567.1 hypothetical protein Hbor_20010 [Halogeometricum borinquense DSM 11551]ELY23753.1 hypothetical protein C499_18419 [Halogeometricum borinquense DSM 11551]QIQ76805.1 hypothetical protein GL213_09940 [Halogeometricum borinquense]
MDIENHLHIAAWIASEAEVETIDSYSENLSRYRDLGYTHIPIPSENKFYNLENDTMMKLDEEQIIHEETHLMDVLRLIQNKPFLLIDRRIGSYYIVTDAGEFVLPHSIGTPQDEYLKKEKVEEYYEDRIDEPFSVFTEQELREEYPEIAKSEVPVGNPYQIITLSDINDRMMKEMLYSVFAELTSQLATRIENEYPDSRELITKIGDSNVGRWKKERMSGRDVHIAEYTTLRDIMEILRSSNPHFVEACGFEAKDDIDSLRKIIDIRNHVMHPNRSLVYNRSDITNVLDAIDEAQRIISGMK